MTLMTCSNSTHQRQVTAGSTGHPHSLAAAWALTTFSWFFITGNNLLTMTSRDFIPFSDDAQFCTCCCNTDLIYRFICLNLNSASTNQEASIRHKEYFRFPNVCTCDHWLQMEIFGESFPKIPGIHFVCDFKRKGMEKLYTILHKYAAYMW